MPFNGTSGTITFKVKLIIYQSGVIEMNYTFSSLHTSISIQPSIGYVGNNNAVTTDDTFLILNGNKFSQDNSYSLYNLYNLLNEKIIIYYVY